MKFERNLQFQIFVESIIDSDNAHDALKDVTDCANILIRFLKLHKNLAERIQFKNCFKT